MLIYVLFLTENPARKLLHCTVYYTFFSLVLCWARNTLQKDFCVLIKCMFYAFMYFCGIYFNFFLLWFILEVKLSVNIQIIKLQLLKKKNCKMLKIVNSKTQIQIVRKKKLDQSLEFCVSQQCSNLEFWPKNCVREL